MSEHGVTVDLSLADMKPSNSSGGVHKNLSQTDLKKAESGEVTDGHSAARVRLSVLSL